MGVDSPARAHNPNTDDAARGAKYAYLALTKAARKIKVGTMQNEHDGRAYYVFPTAELGHRNPKLDAR